MNIKKKTHLMVRCLSILLLIFVAFHARSQELKLYIINLGAGSATYGKVFHQNGELVTDPASRFLIDAGSQSTGATGPNGANILTSYWPDKQNIGNLIITHYDIDHYNLARHLPADRIERLIDRGTARAPTRDAYNDYRNWQTSNFSGTNKYINLSTSPENSSVGSGVVVNGVSINWQIVAANNRVSDTGPWSNASPNENQNSVGVSIRMTVDGQTATWLVAGDFNGANIEYAQSSDYGFDNTTGRFSGNKRKRSSGDFNQPVCIPTDAGNQLLGLCTNSKNHMCGVTATHHFGGGSLIPYLIGGLSMFASSSGNRHNYPPLNSLQAAAAVTSLIAITYRNIQNRPCSITPPNRGTATTVSFNSSDELGGAIVICFKVETEFGRRFIRVYAVRTNREGDIIESFNGGNPLCENNH